MYRLSIFCLGLCCFLLTHHCVEGQAGKVSAKLDFDDATSSNNNNNSQRNNNNNNNNNQTDVPVINGQGQGQAQAQGQDQSTGRGSGNRPKIHGVRVTVDTGDGQQQTKESKESVEITDLGKHKKRVGIHTDITFEITADGDANETSSAQQHADKEDASVPIYKGRASSSSNDARHKSRPSHTDPKSQWNPNYASEPRGSSRSSGDAGYYPQYYPEHVYTSGNSDVGSIYRNGETWTHYVPLWTTERAPAQRQLQSRPSWRPCLCMSEEYRRRRHSKQSKPGVVRTKTLHVDGKLEQPFS